MSALSTIQIIVFGSKVFNFCCYWQAISIAVWQLVCLYVLTVGVTFLSSFCFAL